MAQAIVKKQAEEKSASIDSQVPFQLQAPEVLRPQVLVKETAMGKDESQSIKKKLKKVFSKAKLNVKITKEVKYINEKKANLDTRILTNRKNLNNFNLN
ncbi:MAG: hypothetical protein ACTSP8_10070 [Promethearchaeota archaeon]